MSNLKNKARSKGTIGGNRGVNFTGAEGPEKPSAPAVTPPPKKKLSKHTVGPQEQYLKTGQQPRQGDKMPGVTVGEGSGFKPRRTGRSTGAPQPKARRSQRKSR